LNLTESIDLMTTALGFVAAAVSITVIVGTIVHYVRLILEDQ